MKTFFLFFVVNFFTRSILWSIPFLTKTWLSSLFTEEEVSNFKMSPWLFLLMISASLLQAGAMIFLMSLIQERVFYILLVITGLFVLFAIELRAFSKRPLPATLVEVFIFMMGLWSSYFLNLIF